MSDVTLGLALDTTQAEQQMANFQKTVNQAKRETDKVVREGLKELRTLQRITVQTIGFLRGLVKAFGNTLDPLLDAVLSSVITTVQTVIQIGMAYLAIPGYGWMVYAAIAAFTLGFSVAAQLDIRQKKAEIDSQISGIMQSLTSLTGMIGMGGGMRF